MLSGCDVQPSPLHSTPPHPSFHTLPSSLCPPQHRVTSQITRTGCSANPLWEPRCLCSGPNSLSASFLLALQTSLLLYRSTQHNPPVLLPKECYIHCGDEYHSFSSWLEWWEESLHNINEMLWFFKLFRLKAKRKMLWKMSTKITSQPHMQLFFFSFE